MSRGDRSSPSRKGRLVCAPEVSRACLNRLQVLLDQLAAKEKSLEALRKQEVKTKWQRVGEQAGEKAWDEIMDFVVGRIAKVLGVPALAVHLAFTSHRGPTTLQELRVLPLEADVRAILEEIQGIFISTGLVIGPPGLQLPTTKPDTAGPVLQSAP